MSVYSKIDLRVHRDFSEVFSTVFRFVRGNVRSLFLLLLLVLSPYILFSALFTTLLENYFLGGRRSFWFILGQDDFSQKLSDGITQNIPLVVAFLLLHFFLFVLARAAISVYVTQYVSSENPKSIPIKQLVKETYRKAFLVLPAFLFLLFCFSIPLGIVLIFLKYVVMAYSELLLGMFVFVSVMVLPIIVPIITIIFFHLFFFLKLRDNLTFIKTIQKLFFILKGNLMSLWLFCVCMAGIVFVLDQAMAIPIGIYEIFSSFSRAGQVENNFSVMALIIAFLSRFSFFLFYALMDILSVILFYNFEEKKTGAAILEKINRIGMSDNNFK
jgi:hypothetical protein